MTSASPIVLSETPSWKDASEEQQQQQPVELSQVFIERVIVVSTAIHGTVEAENREPPQEQRQRDEQQGQTGEAVVELGVEAVTEGLGSALKSSNCAGDGGDARENDGGDADADLLTPDNTSTTAPAAAVAAAETAKAPVGADGTVDSKKQLWGGIVDGRPVGPSRFYLDDDFLGYVSGGV